MPLIDCPQGWNRLILFVALDHVAHVFVFVFAFRQPQQRLPMGTRWAAPALPYEQLPGAGPACAL